MGKNASDISDADLINSFKKATSEAAAGDAKGSIEGAKNAAAKKACFKDGALKGKIADAMGKAADKIKDSDVRHFLEEGAPKAAMSLLENCAKENMTSCKDQAKAELAKLAGTNKTLSDRALEMNAKKAMLSDLDEKIRLCVEEAGEDKAGARKCKEDIVKAGISNTRMGKEKPMHAADVAVTLRDAAKEKARQLSADCQTSRAECMKTLKNEMQKMGDNVSDMDVARLNIEGAKAAAKDAARACAEAKKADSAATCDDLTSTFFAAQMRSPPTDPKAKATSERHLKEQIAKGVKKDAMKVCFDAATKSEADACLAELREETEAVTGELFAGLSSKAKEAKEKRAKHAAQLEVVGERFHACMMDADTADAKKACATDLAGKSEVAGIVEDAKKVAMKFSRSAASQDAAASLTRLPR